MPSCPLLPLRKDKTLSHAYYHSTQFEDGEQEADWYQ